MGVTDRCLYPNIAYSSILCTAIFWCNNLFCPGSGGKSKNERFLVIDQDGNFRLRGYNDAVEAKKARENDFKKHFGPKGTIINVLSCFFT